jgi:hypothetical protein
MSAAPERLGTCPLQIFRVEAARYLLLVTHTGLARVRAEPFEALELDLSFLWGERYGTQAKTCAQKRGTA